MYSRSSRARDQWSSRAFSSSEAVSLEGARRSTSNGSSPRPGTSAQGARPRSRVRTRPVEAARAEGRWRRPGFPGHGAGSSGMGGDPGPRDQGEHRRGGAAPVRSRSVGGQDRHRHDQSHRRLAAGGRRAQVLHHARGISHRAPPASRSLRTIRVPAATHSPRAPKSGASTLRTATTSLQSGGAFARSTGARWECAPVEDVGARLERGQDTGELGARVHGGVRPAVVEHDALTAPEVGGRHRDRDAGAIAGGSRPSVRVLSSAGSRWPPPAHRSRWGRASVPAAPPESEALPSEASF